MNIENHHNDIFFNYKILAYPDVVSDLIKSNPVSPINLEINLTNVCNQKCIWCTYDYLHSNVDSLTDTDVERLLSDANKLKIKSITWTGGGEPTTHRGLKKFITQAASYGIKQGINTNGLLLNDELINMICQHFTYIRISLDAASCETYEKCHGINGKNWDKVIENIKNLVNQKRSTNSNVTIGISFLISNQNHHEIEKIAHIAKNIGVDYIQYKPVVSYGNSACDFYTERIWAESISSLKNIKNLESENFSIRVLDYKFNNIKNYKRSYKNCWGCKVLASVGADGSVDICCAHKGKKGFSLGNIKEIPFFDIWKSNKIDEILSGISVDKCPPLCKGDEINRVVNFIRSFDAHKEFI